MGGRIDPVLILLARAQRIVEPGDGRGVRRAAGHHSEVRPRDQLGAAGRAVREGSVGAVPLQGAVRGQSERLQPRRMGGQRGHGEGLLPVAPDLLVAALHEQIVPHRRDVGRAPVARQGDHGSDRRILRGQLDGVDGARRVPEGADARAVDEGQRLEVVQAIARTGHDRRVHGVLSGVAVPELVDAEHDEPASGELDGPEGRRRLLVGLVAVKGEEPRGGVVRVHPGGLVNLRRHRHAEVGHELDLLDLDASESPVGGCGQARAGQ